MAKVPSIILAAALGITSGAAPAALYAVSWTAVGFASATVNNQDSASHQVHYEGDDLYDIIGMTDVATGGNSPFQGPVFRVTYNGTLAAGTHVDPVRPITQTGYFEIEATDVSTLSLSYTKYYFGDTLEDENGTFGFNSIDYDDGSITASHFSDITSLTFSTSLLSTAPEPASWALMLAGFGLTGAAMRRARRVGHAIIT